jgi:hypothetical protein
MISVTGDTQPVLLTVAFTTVIMFELHVIFVGLLTSVSSMILAPEI